MRKLTIIPYVIATFVAGACGGKALHSGDANAAEVTTVSPETSSVRPDRSRDRGNRFVRRRRGSLYREALRRGSAVFTSYTSEHPDNVWGFYMLGLSAWKTGDRDAAVRAFTQALEKDSTHVKSRLNLSRVLIEQGRRSRRSHTFRESWRSILRRTRVTACLAREARARRLERAIEALKRAIVLDERDAWSMNNLARV